MLSNALFILALWGPIACLELKRNSYFPFLVILYGLGIAFGIWLMLNPSEPEIGLPFIAGTYALYVLTGFFFWIREQGNPEHVHFDWKDALRDKK